MATKPRKMKESLHYFDGMAVVIGLGLFELTVPLSLYYEQWNPDDPVGVVLFLGTFFLIYLPFSLYLIYVALVACLNYKVTDRGIEIYKIRKFRYFLPWDQVQSIELYTNGLVVSKLGRYETEKLIGDSIYGPEAEPWRFYPHYINSACYTKKRLARVDEGTILLLPFFPSRGVLERRLKNIRYLWWKSQQQSAYSVFDAHISNQ